MKILQLVCFICILSSAACKSSKNQGEMITQYNNLIFPKGDPLPNTYFTGNAFLTPLVTRNNNNDYSIGNVTFEPGARTHWHTHPKGQTLIITSGEGFYQEKGKAARPLKKGDVVNIPENTVHWHGASANSMFVHIAITNILNDQSVVWLEAVTDAEYGTAKNK